MYLLKLKKDEDSRLRKELRKEKRKERKEEKRRRREKRSQRFNCSYLGSFEVRSCLSIYYTGLR